MPRPSHLKADEADFVGPIRVLVGAALAYMLWLALRPKPADAAALPPAP